MADPPPWTPVTAAVVPHLRKYAKTRGGVQLDDFTDETAIREADVVRALASIATDITAHAGTVPDALWDQAADVAAIGAAAEAVIDLSPDLHDRLQRLYESRRAGLVTAVSDLRDGVADGTTSIPASGSFPAPFGVTRAAF